MAETIEPLVVPLWSKDGSKSTAAKVLDVGETKIKALVRSGEIPSIKVGGHRVIAVADLKAYVDRLRSEQAVGRQPPSAARPA